MLQSIRDRAQGIVIWFIVGLIILSFALWGVEGYLGGGEETHVASVDGMEISENELARVHQNQLEELRRMLGDSYRPGMVDEGALRRQALDQLIDRYVMRQLLQQGGFAAAPQQVRATIQGMEAFHDQNGAFSLERYEQLLGYQGMSPDQFEREVARDLTAQQLYGGVVDTGFVTAAELERYRQLLNQTRDVGVLTVAAESFLDEVKIADDAVRAFYDENRDRFMKPAQVEIEYLDLSLEDVADEIDVSEEELRRYYEEHQGQYTSPEQRRARHILIATGPERSEQEAKSEMDALRRQIEEGAAFEDLAKQHSDDPGSRAQGGDLGFFARGAMDPAFEEAVFALEEGQVSAPVRSSYGYHLIKLEAVQPPAGKSFEQVREDIARELRMQEAEPQFYEVLDRAINLAYEHPDTLEVAAEELGLEVRTAGPFSREGGEGVASNPEVVREAFGAEVLEDRINSEPVEIAPNRHVILRLRQHHPAEPRPFEAVAEEIRTGLKRDEARERAMQAARDAAERLRSGAAAGDLAGAGDWQRVAALSRTPGEEEQVQLPSSVRRLAFRLPHPGEAEPSVEVRSLPSGDAAVVALYGVKPGEPKETDPKARDFAQAAGQSEFARMLQFARQTSDVKINEDAL